MRAISFVRLSRRAAMLMFLLFMATATYAQITPSDDAYVNSTAPTTNYGTAGHSECEQRCQHRLHSL